MTPADTAVLVLVLVCLPAVNLYPAIYAARPWRSTRQGRALMIKAIGNMILIDMAFAAVVFGDYPYRDTIRIVGFSVFTAGIWYLFASLLTSPGAENYPPRTWFGPVVSWFRRRRS